MFRQPDGSKAARPMEVAAEGVPEIMGRLSGIGIRRRRHNADASFLFPDIAALLRQASFS